MVKTLTREVVLETHVCGTCGITYAAPLGFWDERELDGRIWYCPNGDQRLYSKRIEDQLREELSAKEQRLQQVRRDRDSYREDAESERRSHTATRGHLTRARKRAAAALCPVEDCNKKLVGMAEHLRLVHPDYQPEEA